jgi:hypothetical protein
MVLAISWELLNIVNGVEYQPKWTAEYFYIRFFVSESRHVCAGALHNTVVGEPPEFPTTGA